MISFEQALAIVTEKTYEPGTELVDITVSLNRIIAEDVISDIDMPPFDKSAMDGYACRQEDIKNILEVIETIPAGTAPIKTIEKNNCSKIMTGAMIPPGADCVLMVEQTETIENNKIRFTGERTNKNICFKSEDISKGQKLFSKGTLLKPPHIAILATTGYSRPLVYKQPSVAVLSTGDELVEPGVIPGPSQIRNSNAYQLYSQILACGCKPNYYGIASDDKTMIHDILKKATYENDVTILTGGVSMGDYDFVPEILEKLKIQLHFKKIAIQPGRPTVFGTLGKKFIFGLPGNPVSSFMLFEMLVKPMLFKMMGNTMRFVNIKLPLGNDYTRKRSDRKAFIPVKISAEGTIIPVEYHGSAHLNSLCETDGIIIMNIGQEKINKGELTDVRLI
jgi:molybdopterin molybdotransferase